MYRSAPPPLVSVIIPTWNAADFLPATLETVFAQTWPEVEVVVVDDGSTDNTDEVLAGYEGRITLVKLENSGGPSRPRNKGVEKARGEFIAFFDSDDLMEPEKLAEAMEVFAAHPDVDVVCTNFRSIDMEGGLLKEDYLVEYVNFREHLQPAALNRVGLLDGDAAFRQLIRANFVGTSSVVCRRESLAEVGPFVEEMKNSDDVEMWRRLANHGCRFAFVDRVLHSYRINPDGISARGAKRFPSVIMGLERHLPNCRHKEDRRFVLGRIRELRQGLGWSKRLDGDFTGALEEYRAALKMGWDVRGVAGYLKTLLSSLARRG